MRGIPKQLVSTALHGNTHLLVRVALTSLGRTGFTVAGILLIREFLAAVLGEGDGIAADIAARVGQGPAIWLVAALLIGCFLMSSLLRYDNLVVEQKIVRSIELRVMEKVIRHLLNLSVPFVERHSQGDLVQAVRRDVAKFRMVMVAYITLLVEGLLAIGLVVSAILLSWMTFLVIFVIMAAGIPVFFVAKRATVLSQRVRSASTAFYDVVLQLLHGVRIIRVYRTEGDEANRALVKIRHYFEEFLEAIRIQSLAQAALESVSGVTLAVVIVVGGFQVLNGNLNWPELFAFLMAIAALSRPIGKMGTQYMLIRRHSSGVDQVVGLLSERPEIEDIADPLPFPAQPQELRFESVSFGYDGNTVLSDLTFRVRAGEALGVVGPSGAGKTTVLSLVARFFDPTSGTILVDGRDLREYEIESFYRHVAIVTQEPFLFDTTVYENIQCGDPAADRAQVEAAAQAAEIHEEILGLPDGYDTILGSGGRRLSAGQSQRVNIARAILKNAPILLLDEATSSLDSIAESRVQRAIENLMHGRTTLIVAHRLSTLRGAAQILVLRDGRSVGQGRHEELLRSCITYREMWEWQQLRKGDPDDQSGPDEEEAAARPSRRTT